MCGITTGGGARTPLRRATAALGAALALGGCDGPRWYGDPGSGPRVGWGGGYAVSGPNQPPSHQVRPEPWTWQRHRDEWRQQEALQPPR